MIKKDLICKLWKQHVVSKSFPSYLSALPSFQTGTGGLMHVFTSGTNVSGL